MSDVRLRALERALLLTGTVEAEAAVLAERLRLGHLDEARLALAAYAGSVAAMRVLGDPVLELSVVGLSTTRGLRRWSRMLRLAGRRDALGCVESSARTALLVAVGEGRLGRTDAEALEQTLGHVRDVADGMRSDARERLRAAAAPRATWGWWGEPDLRGRATDMVSALARAAVVREHELAATAAAEALVHARHLAGVQADVVDQVVRAELERLALA